MRNADGPVPRVVPLADRRHELRAMDAWAWPTDPDDFDGDVELQGMEWERTAGALVGDEMAGVHSVYTLRMPVPGGDVPTAGLTWVGVHPQHRRRGVLTAMMRHHLDSAHASGEPVSALWASEPAIYGRYGYGMATRAVRLTLPRGAAMVDVPGTERLVVTFHTADADTHAALVAACHERARKGRPGMVSRDSDGLRRKMLADPKHWREGGEALRLLVVTDPDGDVRGYALFRRKMAWPSTGPDGTVEVREAVALDAAASRVLWGRLVDLDLMARVRTGIRPVDDPLVHQLVDLRATDARLTDGMWVRLVDVRTALASRAYRTDVDAVIDVLDPSCPWNSRRWRLTGGPDGATCTPTSDAADLTIGVSALGSAYLGGETLLALAGAGLVGAERHDVLVACSRAFAADVAPYCGWVF